MPFFFFFYLFRSYLNPLEYHIFFFFLHLGVLPVFDGKYALYGQKNGLNIPYM